MQLPPGMTLPQGMTIPQGMQIPPGMQLLAIPPGGFVDYTRNLPPPPPGMTYAPVPITFSPNGVPVVNVIPIAGGKGGSANANVNTGSGSGNGNGNGGAGEGSYGGGIRWAPVNNSTGANAAGGEGMPAHLLQTHQPPQMQMLLQQQQHPQGQGQGQHADPSSAGTGSGFGVLKPAGFGRGKKKSTAAAASATTAAVIGVGDASSGATVLSSAAPSSTIPSSSFTPMISETAVKSDAQPMPTPGKLQGRTIYNTGTGSEVGPTQDANLVVGETTTGLGKTSEGTATVKSAKKGRRSGRGA